MTSSWKYCVATSAGNDSKIFSINNLQLKMHSHFFNSQCIATIHVCHNSLYQYCGYRFTTFVICACCINSQIGDYYSGHIFGFSLIFISSSWSMYFLITSSDKITISSISSDTTAVVEGVVDNLLPKKFFKFKL